ncbi:MAG: tetratricopeptide repeat protein, partial [Promethearchaeota archaeon]
TDEQLIQSETRALPKEMLQAKKMIREGKINDGFEIVSDFERKSDISDYDLLICKLLKGTIFRMNSQYHEAIEYANQVLQDSQKLGDLISYFDALLIQAYCDIEMGNLNKGETKLKQAEDLFEKLKVATKLDLNERESFMVRIKAESAKISGDYHLSCNLNEIALELAKESDSKELIAASLLNLAENYQALGDYNRAIQYAKRALEVHYPPWLLISLGYLIENLLAKGDIVNAKIYFQQMGEVREKYKFEKTDLDYRFYEALILKTSLRARDRIKAEDLFKKLVEERRYLPTVVKAIINLCGLLLIELRITNDSDIINEIKPYVTKLLSFADRQQSYYFAAETYLLQEKIHLLTFNKKEAMRSLTQAFQIAERFGNKQFKSKFSKEIKNLRERSDLWDKLKEDNAPMAKRLDLARIDEIIKGMTQKTLTLKTLVKEEEVAISKDKKICLVCKGEVLKYSYICVCGAIYCEKCARAVENLENVCWVCDATIDSSKPVQLEEEESKKIDKKLKKQQKKQKKKATSRPG